MKAPIPPEFPPPAFVQRAFERLEKHFGTQTAIAAAAGLKNYQAYQQWKIIPADYVLKICKASGWQLTPHILRPDLYPNPSDAMPAEADA